MEKISILLVEDSSFWLENISKGILNETDFHLMGTATTKEEALVLAVEYNPDIIILDINLTDNNLDGIVIAQELSNKKEVDSKIIILSGIMEEYVILESFAANNVVNYLSKYSALEIYQAIRDAYYGTAGIHSDVAEILRKAYRKNRTEVKLSLLTPAERELYELNERGFTKNEMANKLHKSFETIKSQLRSMRNKMKNR
ncbi:response regulator [Chengkuizengella axinellae]|uniref:Response regulator transcription factor n=1 Tax=Chengkuizengella axinellae TaxID=3064388 RepID=A0ABT9IT78_9BACL|nr:response regulator transcription factor [Chengkuizengella sp. 2205SS18-9]MDP5272554.1 response regulator transcription factor [Chengkuizengella sp. 2205SS18-9]